MDIEELVKILVWNGEHECSKASSTKSFEGLQGVVSVDKELESFFLELFGSKILLFLSVSNSWLIDEFLLKAVSVEWSHVKQWSDRVVEYQELLVLKHISLSLIREIGFYHQDLHFLELFVAAGLGVVFIFLEVLVEFLELAIGHLVLEGVLERHRSLQLKDSLTHIVKNSDSIYVAIDVEVLVNVIWIDKVHIDDQTLTNQLNLVLVWIEEGVGPWNF